MYVTSIVLQLFFLLCHGTLFFIHDEEVRGSINVVIYALKTISDYQKNSINLILVIEVLKPCLSAH